MNQDPEKGYRGNKRRILGKHLALDFSLARKDTSSLTKPRTISKEEYEKNTSWGLLTSIDLDECDPEIIRNAEKVKQHVRELCKLIDIKRFGETVVVDFGEDPRVTGFSMTQLIETSLISAHYGSGATKYVYLDIFSCKWYDQEKAFEFTKNFFRAKKANFNVVLRGKEMS